MDASINKTQALINELIMINNDRYEGYFTAAKEIKDLELKDVFLRFGDQSQKFNDELIRLLTSPKACSDASFHDDLYRACIYVKASATIDDKKGVLSSCEMGEDETLHSYKDMLEENDIPENIRYTVSKQAIGLEQASRTIKLLINKI